MNWKTDKGMLEAIGPEPDHETYLKVSYSYWNQQAQDERDYYSDLSDWNADAATYWAGQAEKREREAVRRAFGYIFRKYGVTLHLPNDAENILSELKATREGTT